MLTKFHDQLTYCDLMTQIWVNIYSGNGLLPVQCQVLPEPMFIVADGTLKNKFQWNLNQSTIIFI